MRKKSATAVLARLKVLTGCTTDTALASALGISPQTLSSWKSRDTIPYALCVEVADARGVSLDWLLVGEGPMTRGEGRRPRRPGVCGRLRHQPRRAGPARAVPFAR
ncbi:helix-turn-helix transcriptional regulator [Azotobacter sp. CWF10]